MIFVTIFITLLFQLLFFSPYVQLQPVYTSQPSNPSSVVEGQNLDLQWSFNLNGQSSFLTRFLNITAGELGAVTVAVRNENNNATVQAGYENQFRAVISDTQATLTILAVPRSFNGEKYQLLIVTASPNFFNLASVKVGISVLFKPQDIQLLTNTTTKLACRGNYLNFTCSVGSANPQVMSYQLLENDAVIDTGSSGMWVRLMSSSGVFAFRCQANNTVGTANSTSVNITVGVPPTIQPIQDETITEGGTLNVSCNASGTPQPVVSWVEISSGQRFSGSVLKLPNINSNQAGEYRCQASNDCENSSSTATIHVKFAPSVTIQQCPNAVTEGHNATLYCNATGYPVPNIVWINASSGNIMSHNKTLVLRAITRNEKGSYACHASNEIGNSTKTCGSDVHYPPKVIYPLEERKTDKNGTTIKCVAEGNPPPEYVWEKADGPVVKSGDSFKVMEDGNYTCNASNRLGNDLRTIFIVIGDTEHRRQVTLVNAEYLPEYSNLSSEPSRILITNFSTEMDGVYENDTLYNRTEVIGLRNGSVIVSFVMYFETPVTANEGLAKLKDAVDNAGRLGSFTVQGLKIIQVNPTTTVPTGATERSTSASTTSSTKDDLPWPIIGGAIGGVVLLVVIIVIVAWCVHKKRKCRRKDSKIHNSESQVLHDRNDIEDGAHVRVNDGYAVSGPPSADGSQTPVQQLQQQQQASAVPPPYAVVNNSKKKNKDNKNGNENIPDYAVVDKSKKKKKEEAEISKKEEKNKGDKNANANGPENAVVDKSKKKKKEEDEHAYASVDMSKKSKKKLKPGEMVYADLGDFKPLGQMPEVSTSPEPLPSIKRATPYQGTEYADITQFLKGGATLPAGQETEMEPTYANSGGGQGAATKENLNTGQKDTGSKVTPM